MLIASKRATASVSSRYELIITNEIKNNSYLGIALPLLKMFDFIPIDEMYLAFTQKMKISPIYYQFVSGQYTKLPFK